MGADGSRPVEAGSDGFWDLYSRYYDAIYQLMPYRRLLWDAYQALELEAGMRVLDAGCGTGNFEAFLAEKAAPAVEVHALDFSSSMLAVARGKCDAQTGCFFEQADLNLPLPFADASFDRILSINVLYALEDPQATLSELLRVLKPEGLMVLTSPRPEFSVRPLVTDHLRRVRNINGAGRRARVLLKSAWILSTTGVAQLTLNNLVINKREAQGRYRSLNHDEFRSLLEAGEPEGLSRFDIGLALADQNLFATAVKAAAT